MQKVIGNLLYDTEKADEIATWSWGYASDFSHFIETLYRTKNGRFFIYGSGGPQSGYASHHSDGSRSGGQDIRALDTEDALHWLRKRNYVTEIQSLFPDAIEEA